MICSVDGKEIPEDEGYFEEGGAIYCEKHYAEKRYKEVTPEVRKKWLENTLTCIKVEIKVAEEQDRPKVIERWIKKIPKEFEEVVKKL
jgi:hypothetical protein